MLPPPDIRRQAPLNFKLVNYRTITTLRRGFIEVLASRGCPYACTYCQNRAVTDAYRADLNTALKDLVTVRRRDPSGLVDEIGEFVRRVDPAAKAVSFADDQFAVDTEWLTEFAAEYVDEIRLPYVCSVDLNHLNEESVTLLDRSGCYMVKFGLESGDDRLNRQLLKRPFSTRRIESACRLLAGHGINTRAYVMFGLPTETPLQMLTTFELCGRLRIDSVRPSVFLPTPSTRLYDYCEQGNWITGSSGATTYFSPTTLRFPPETVLFIDKLRAIHPWVMSCALNAAAQRVYRPLIDSCLAMSAPDWRRDRTTEWVARVSRETAEDLRSAHVPHYFLPFPERPDICFLDRERPKKIVNFDD